MESIKDHLKLFLSKHSTTKQDVIHSNYIFSIFEKQSIIHDSSLIIDCHNYNKEDLFWILEFIMDYKFIIIKKIIFITGLGNHTKKPIMDYYTQLHWKPPLHMFILKYFMEHKLGGKIQDHRGQIDYKIK